ncbi:MAG TPA: PfkB family carbohydrate kinase [Trebonia sp.]|nr:PfkB family carbohydrate kinase [Trebonia sp.]
MDLPARLTVLGSLNMDISVTVPALPSPGATVLGGAAAFAPGGKGANQAVAAARLGAAAGIQVSMVGCVGDDDFGRALLASLREEGVDGQSVRIVPGAPTGIAMITVDEAGENIITVAPGANREVGAQEMAALNEAGEIPAVLVISAEVPVPAILAVLSAPGRPPLTVVNLAPAPPRPEALEILKRRPDWLVVNEPEAAAVLGRPVSGPREAARAAADLVAAGARNAVVTAGAAGAAYQGAGTRESSPRTVQGFTVQARDTVGAGDTFVGALAVALAAGVHPAEAVTAASAAAATAATRPGTQAGMPRPADVRTATGYEWPVRSAGQSRN